jgi:signal transduction histidine kinase
MLEAAIRDGRVEDEGWRMRKDGPQFWANVVVTAVYDEAGALHGFAKITRDLTERRRLEGQQRQLALLAERERIAGGLFEWIVQGMFAVGLELQAATFADDSTLRAKVDAAVQHLDEVIVELRNHQVTAAMGAHHDHTRLAHPFGLHDDRRHPARRRPAGWSLTFG